MQVGRIRIRFLKFWFSGSGRRWTRSASLVGEWALVSDGCLYTCSLETELCKGEKDFFLNALYYVIKIALYHVHMLKQWNRYLSMVPNLLVIKPIFSLFVWVLWDWPFKGNISIKPLDSLNSFKRGGWVVKIHTSYFHKCSLTNRDTIFHNFNASLSKLLHSTLPVPFTWIQA